jgi:hypothetical protein
MATYRGPHVAVRQNFETTPPAVAVENLPTAIVGTPYEVYKDEKLASYDGIDVDLSSGTPGTTSAPWVVSGDNNVIYSESQGAKIYNFYPPFAKIVDKLNGGTFENPHKADGVTELPITSTGITLSAFSRFTLKEITGSTKAYIPYSSATATITISTSSKKVECSDGRFIDDKLVSGLRVVDASNNVVGYIDYVESNTVLYLKANSTQSSATDLYFGSSVDTTAMVSKASYLYDPDTNFVREGVKVGDVITNIASVGIADGGIAAASVVSVVNDNLVEIFAGASQFANYGNPAVNKPVTLSKVYSSYDDSDLVPATVMVTAYDIERFVGFTEQYESSSGAITVSIATTTLTIASGTLSPAVGDCFVDLTNNIRYGIIGVTTPGTTYTLDKAGTVTTQPAVFFKTSDAANQIKNDLIADYRAVMNDNLNTVFKSSDVDLIGTNGIFGVASIYNELAFMIQTVMGVNGGRVCYAVGVSPIENITSAYSDAMEALKFFDVYSHCFGSDEAGVNALVPSYVDEQSDPYEGHERIGVLAYNQDDVYKLGSGAGTISSGTITSSGVNLTTIGLGVGDTVMFENSTGDVTVATVISTPTSTQAVVDYTTANDATSFSYYAGTKSKQGNRIKALGTGNRRISIVWPGKFWADTTAAGVVPALTEVELPSYYLTALVAGMDGGQKVSQSFTRFVTAVPGLSNVQLKTNSYFRKADLDNIGSGGIDILMQANPISNTIFSRHDLTTNMDAVEYRERSITKQADQTAKTVRAVVDPYIGKYNITDALLGFINQVITIAGKALLKDGVIKGISVVSVKRDPDVADRINIVVKVTVFVAANYYDIDLNIVSR